MSKRTEEPTTDSGEAFERLVQAAQGIDAAALDALIDMLLDVRDRMDEGPKWTH